jgi:hypothetical protein
MIFGRKLARPFINRERALRRLYDWHTARSVRRDLDDLLTFIGVG